MSVTEETPGTPRGGKFTSDAMLMGAWQVIGAATTFLVGLVISRRLGPAGKGQITVLQQVPWFAYMLLNVGIGGANAYFAGKRLRTQAAAITDSLAYAAAISLVGAPVVVLVTRSFFPTVQAVPVQILMVASLFLPAWLASAYVTGVAIGQGRVHLYALSQCAGAAFTLTTVTAAFFTGRLDITLALAVQLASLAITTGAVLFGLSRGEAILGRPSLTRLLELRSYAVRAHLTDLTSYLSLRQDVLLLGMLSTAGRVGVYSVGVAFTEVLWMLPNSLAQALFARSVRAESEEGARTAATASRVAVMLMLVFALVIGLLIHPLVTTLYGGRFAGAATVFLILAPGIVVLGAGRTVLNYLMAHARLVPGIAATAAAINLVANIIVIPRYGHLGAAAVSCVTYSLAGVLIVREFSRMTGIPMAQAFLPGIADARLLASLLRSRLTRRRDTA